MAGDGDDAFSFGDFKFSTPSPQSHITSTSNYNKDNIFQSSSSQFQSNNAFSSNSTRPISPIRADPGPINFQKPRGALPLSLFGEVEEEEEDLSSNNHNNNDETNHGDANGSFDPNPLPQSGKFGVNNNNNGVLPESENGLRLNFDGVVSDLIVDGEKVKNDIIINGNDSDNDNDDDDDDGEWDFKCAISSNGVVEGGDFKDGSVVPGSKAEPLTMIEQEKQAGQYASSSIDFKPGSISFVPQTRNGPNHQSIDFFAASYGNDLNHQPSDLFVASFGNETNQQSCDLFAASSGNDPNHQSCDFFATSVGNGLNHQTSGLNVGYNSSTNTTNGFMWDPFPRVESNGSGTNASSINQDDDFDDFGDFIDASKEVVSKEQQEQVVVQTNHAEAQLPNGEVQQKQTQTGYAKGALPLSFFGDDTEDSVEDSNIQNEVVHITTPFPGNSFSRQGSVISINDLISNLYSQAQLTSVNSTGKPAENEVLPPRKAMGTTPLVGDDDWDDGSWEFKGAALENGVREQFSTSVSGAIAQEQPGIFPELHDYKELYHQLRDYLCCLLSCQIDELKIAQSSDTMTANGENSESVDGEIQEAYKILEESVNTKEEFQKDSSLNKLLEALQGPKLNVIESDFQLSKRLQLAANEWRVALELLRHAISVLKMLTLGSADEQSFYASTWFKILNVCFQELRHGASIWKRASEMNVQHQIWSDFEGQQNILALGEVYKVVKLLGLSAKVYKPFILRNVSNSSEFFGVLDECDVIWSNLGLEEFVKSLSNNVDFGFSESAEALIASIKNILDIDAVTMHGCVFIQRKPICQLSLLPHEMLADLKTVTWGEKAYFLNLANLWANLISFDPPQLPHMQVC